ncbi:aminopeptidase P family N-terminal domain-containing protein, partial [Planococcus sp. SIMBA_143]
MQMIKFDKVRTLIDKNNLDAILVMSGYNRRYLTGFTGSSGAAIIT